MFLMLLDWREHDLIKFQLIVNPQRVECCIQIMDPQLD